MRHIETANKYPHLGLEDAENIILIDKHPAA
jgi:hypothetical protein